MAKDLNKKDKKVKKDAPKTKKRINPFDVVIVLLILCLLGALGYRVYDGVTVRNSNKESKYVMEFECERVYSSLSGYLNGNTAVYLADGELLGYIYTGKNGVDAVHVIEKVTDTEGSAEETDEAFETDQEKDETSSSEVSESQEEDTSFVYELVKLGGKIKLNGSTVKINNGGYYSVGEINFAAGSVIEVHTDKAVFTLRVVSIQALD